MQRRALCQFWLTCEDEHEANRIAAALLEARLIVCSKTMPLAAEYWWKGAVNRTKEVLMVMDSSLELFDEVEAVIKKLHSYDVYVLQAMPLLRMSRDAEQWLMGELKGSERLTDSEGTPLDEPDEAAEPFSGDEIPPIDMAEIAQASEDDEDGERVEVRKGLPDRHDYNEAQERTVLGGNGTGPSQRPDGQKFQAPTPARNGTRITIN